MEIQCIFELMYRDTPVVQFGLLEDTEKPFSFEVKDEKSLSTILFERLKELHGSLKSWLDNRKPSMTRTNMRYLLFVCGCNTMTLFIVKTHLSSLYDSFWVRRLDARLSWKDVNVYQTKTSREFQSIVYLGKGTLNTLEISAEFQTGGVQPKFWDNKNGVYMLFRGKPNESKYDILATQLLDYWADLGFISYRAYVRYTRSRMGTSVSQCFVDEHVGYVPFSAMTSEYRKRIAENEILLDEMRLLKLFDIMTFNKPRTNKDVGLLVNNTDYSVVHLAPIFNTDKCCLADVSDGQEYVEVVKSVGLKDNLTWLSARHIAMIGSLRHFKYVAMGTDVSDVKVELLNSVLQWKVTSILNCLGVA